MTDNTSQEAAKARANQFLSETPRALLEEAFRLPQKVANMNAKPMLRINPILEMADRLSKATEPYTACKRGCNHCCHILVTLTGIEAQQLGHKIGVAPAKLNRPKLRPKEAFGYHTPCTFLKEGECSIYEHRPLPCRNHSSFELTDEPCRLTHADGSPKTGGKLVAPSFSGLKEAINVVVNLVGKTEFADIRDYFPNGKN